MTEEYNSMLPPYNMVNHMQNSSVLKNLKKKKKKITKIKNKNKKKKKKKKKANNSYGILQCNTTS